VLDGLRKEEIKTNKLTQKKILPQTSIRLPKFPGRIEPKPDETLATELSA